MSNIVIASLYKFIRLTDFHALQSPLLQVCLDNGLKGTILLAEEGINGTLAGLRAGIDNALDYLRQDPRFSDLAAKESLADDFPFRRMKVKLKNEIVTIGKPEIDPTKRAGIYVAPEDWNDLVSDPEVLVLDARNHYEVGIGTFQGATDLGTESFRDFPDSINRKLDPGEHKKVAMYCTGGIRCEKAASFMLEQGFLEVYHLQGGILKYLEQLPKEQSLWRGECFVFDDRVTVDHDLKPGSYRQCYACKRPLTQEEMSSPQYQEGVSCPNCAGTISDDKLSRFAERQKQIELARARKGKATG